MGGRPREKGVSYSGEVMVVATAEQMELFDAAQIVNPQMGGAGEDPDRMVYYPGGSATLRELNEMKEAGGPMWRATGGARRRSRRSRRRVTKKRQIRRRRVSRR
jgi:hypothetical protein